MAYDYGYGKLENELIDLLCSGKPDFHAAEALIRQGADINATGKHDDENVLSEILTGQVDIAGDLCDDCTENRGIDPGYSHHANSALGPLLCATIRFFLNHGFDVNRRSGCYGAQCLWALTRSTFDRYMIIATKLLLDAGATNRTISPTSTDADETPWNSIGLQGDFQGTEHNYDLANLYEALYQIYQAAADGRPYNGIDSYEMAIGKKVMKVLAEVNDTKPIFFSMDLPQFKRDNCYTQTLYFVYDNGVLVSNQYADFWTDSILPVTNLVDISSSFDGVVGSTIMGFTYDHRTIVKGFQHYGQPITTIEMDSGCKIRFSINFGEVKEEERAAFYELLH